jgi:hypothetical protein
MVSQTPQIEPIIPAYHIRILRNEQLEKFTSSRKTSLDNEK